jgi:hypothetical protein
MYGLTALAVLKGDIELHFDIWTRTAIWVAFVRA